MRALVNYFAHRPVVANVVMFGLILLALLFWRQIGKEEMPEFAMEWVRVSLRYPGAAAEDVELFVTKPIEEKLKGLTGLKAVMSTSSYSSSSFRIQFEPNLSNLAEKIQEVKDAVNSAILPREVEDPTYRQFRSSEKAIIDIGVYLKGVHVLDLASRIELQKYALAFKNKILAQPEISGVDSSGYLRPELQIKILPEKLEKYELSMNQVKAQIIEKNVRRPIGSLEDQGESEVTIVSELDSVDSIKDVIVSSGFQGQKLKLSEIAVVEEGFEKSNTVIKVQGHEGIIFNIQKSSSTDILSGQKAIVNFIESFRQANPNSPVEFTLMDDESYDVRNRLSLIGTNGIMGFCLIVLVLFLFLDFKSGIWVAMGIPFSLAFTVLMAMAIGYTVNNMTLAAIIVVLGIVVDDAIIVAENVVRKYRGDLKEAVDATVEVVSPILASVLTTCAAFLPLFFFSGRFGLFVKYLPAIIFFMLFASLIESYFILPSHMTQRSKMGEWFGRVHFFERVKNTRAYWTAVIERHYTSLLKKVLHHRFWTFLGFITLLVGTIFIFSTEMKYSMFPREESRQFRLKVVAPEGVTRQEMAHRIQPIEDILTTHPVVMAVRSHIGQSRRGGEVKENEASIRVEILPPSEREISFKQLIASFEKKFDELAGFEKIHFQKSWFGSDSGSPIEIEVQENNDENRRVIVDRLREALGKRTELTNVEVERPVSKNEYRLKIRKSETSRLGINYEQLSSALRSYIEGDILYTLNSGEEEVDVRYTSHSGNKKEIEGVLGLTVANQESYLVPIRGLVEIVKGKKPANIQRVNYKRTTSIYADLVEKSGKTPLEVGEELEKSIFPQVTVGFPAASLHLRGEIEDSRESQSEFGMSIVMVLVMTFVLLVFLFDSIWLPLLIGAIIPFGMVGTVLAFWSHGMSQYGFFAVVGTLGMIGVVINDSIVLIDRLKSQIIGASGNLLEKIAEVSSTRLRAVVLTTVTTVAGLFPTAYGIGGYDSMLAEMMLALGWGLLFGMLITLFLVPCLYSLYAPYRGEKKT